MNINKERVRRQFNRHAHEYDRYARVQKQMADQLFSHLMNIDLPLSSNLNILEIGCGTGYLTEKLVSRFPEAKIVAMDLAERMIASTKERLNGRTNKLVTVMGDAEKVILDRDPSNEVMKNAPFDLIISNATFQWFNDTRKTVQAYLQRLKPRGIFAFSTFGPKTFQELHQSFRLAEEQLGLPPQQHGQTFLHLRHWQDYITPFAQPIEVYEQCKVETYPTVRDFLYQVKKMGAGNATQSQQKGHLGVKKLLQLMEQYYVEQFSMDDGIQVTYHIYIGVFKT